MTLQLHAREISALSAPYVQPVSTPQVRGTSTSGVGDSQAATRAVPPPPGAQAGDVIQVAIELWDSTATNPTITPPNGGWSLIVNYVSTTDGFMKLKVWEKVLRVGEAGVWTFSGFGSHFSQGQAIAASGIDLSARVDGAIDLQQNASGTTLPANSKTTTGADLMIHWVANENSSTQLPPTGYTERQEANYLKLSTKQQSVAGAESIADGSQSASTLKLGVLLGLKPMASGVDLTIQGATQGQTAGNVSLTQVHVLAVQGAAQGQTAENAALVQTINLLVAGCTQAQTADHVTVTAAGALSVADAVHSQTSQGVALEQVHQLVASGASQLQTAQSPTLTQAHFLEVDPSTLGQQATQLGLTQLHALSVNGAVQAQTAGQVQLTGGATLLVQDATQAHTAGTVALVQQHSLAIDSTLQAQVADLVELAQLHLLEVAPAFHAHLADGLVLVAIGEYEAPTEGVAIPRPYYALAVVRTVKTTAVVRSPAATATVRSNDEAG